MKTKTFSLTLALLLVLAGGVLTGCDKDGKAEIHIDGDKVEENLDQAGEQVERGLDQAGEQLERAGDEMARGAEQVGEAIERGAEQVEAEVGPVLDDAAITARVKARLIADPEVKGFQIDVDTVDGRVALNGMVSSAEQRSEAEDLARGTQGVRQVVNLIQIAGQDVPLKVPPAQ